VFLEGSRLGGNRKGGHAILAGSQGASTAGSARQVSGDARMCLCVCECDTRLMQQRGSSAADFAKKTRYLQTRHKLRHLNQLSVELQKDDYGKTITLRLVFLVFLSEMQLCFYY